jgi:hypothetical protein
MTITSVFLRIYLLNIAGYLFNKFDALFDSFELKE